VVTNRFDITSNFVSQYYVFLTTICRIIDVGYLIDN